MKPKSVLAGLAILLWAGTAAGYELSGRVWVAGGRAAANATVHVTCSGKEGQTAADANGSYTLASPGTGKCIVKVTHGGASARTVIHVSGRTRANLELRKSGGAWSLTRK